jgi:acetyl-CoA carboxylase carboxyltransferase component
MSDPNRDGRFTWASAVEELARRQRSAEEPGGAERIERRRTQGLGTVHERVAKITERFYEVGMLARFIERDADAKPIEDLPSSYVCGLGEVDGSERVDPPRGGPLALHDVIVACSCHARADVRPAVDAQHAVRTVAVGAVQAPRPPVLAAPGERHNSRVEQRGRDRLPLVSRHGFAVEAETDGP